MTSIQVLSDFASALASGAVKVVDLTAPLGPETPVIKLPPEIGKNTPPVKVHAISNYDEDGPFWAWNWLEARRAHRHAFRRAAALDQRQGLSRRHDRHASRSRISSRPSASSTARRRRRRIPTICSPSTASRHGRRARRDPGGQLGAAAHRLVQAQRQRSNLPQRRRQGAAFAGPDRRGDRLSDLQGRDRLGFGDGRHRRRLGGRHGPAFPGPYAHAQGQPLRPREPLPSRPAAAEGRGPDRRAAEVRRRHRLVRCARSRSCPRSKPTCRQTTHGGRRLCHRRRRDQCAGRGGRCSARRAARCCVLERNDRDRRLPAHRGDHRAGLHPRRDGDDARPVPHLARLCAIGKELEARGFAVAHSPTCRPACCVPDGSHAILAQDRGATSRPSRPARQATARPSPPKWTAWAPTRPFCSRCSAARSGRARCPRRSRARPGGAARAGLPAWFGEALGPRAAISKRPTVRRRCRRFGRRGSCTPASIRKAPIPRQMAK